MRTSGRRAWLAGLLGLALLAPGARAGEEPKRLNPASAPDVQDVLFYGKARPVLIRLHVLVDGKPFGEAWGAYVKKRFDYADRDRNGSLDRDEIKYVPSAAMLQQMTQANQIIVPNQPPARFEDVDADGDGKVTLEELTEYYRKARLAPIQVVSSAAVYGGGLPNNLTAILFRHLDRNKDGKLSREELARADRLVARLDANDDETVDAFELLQGEAATARRNVLTRPVQQPPGMAGWGGAPGTGPFYLVPRDKDPRRLTQRLQLSKELITRYDKDNSGKLTREEIGLDEELFNKLDRNKDGVLDAVELLRYVVLSPDMDVTVNLGTRTVAVASVRETPGRKANLAGGLRRSGMEGLTLVTGGAEIEVRGAGTVANDYVRRPQAYFGQVFNAADPGNKGVIELKKLAPQFQNLRGMLEMADADGDGKVTRDEFNAFLTLQAGASQSTLTLTVNELGQGLFELLDANRDGRLSVRELRTAWKRLAPYDRNNDGAVDEGELPFQYQLVVSSGPAGFTNLRRPAFPGAQPQPVRVPTDGPLWFRKMDRNGDGDISPREFLGTPEEFKKLDEDGDGFISLEEAVRADARMRKKAAKQP